MGLNDIQNAMAKAATSAGRSVDDVTLIGPFLVAFNS